MGNWIRAALGDTRRSGRRQSGLAFRGRVDQKSACHWFTSARACQPSDFRPRSRFSNPIWAAPSIKPSRLTSVLLFALCVVQILSAADTIVVQDWVLWGSATHQQVPPPAGFTRPSVNFDVPLGVFTGRHRRTAPPRAREL